MRAGASRSGLTLKRHRRGVVQGTGLAVVLALAITSPVSAVERDGREAAVYTFAFDNADVAQVAQEVLGAVGVPYVVDPSVRARISLRIDQRLTKAQLLQAFEAALAANDIAVVENGETLLLTSRSKARTSASVRPLGAGAGRAGYEVVAAPLSFAQPTDAAKALEAITGPGVVLYANDKLGMIVLGGSGRQLEAALESLKVFDQSGLENARIRWFELSQASAGEVAAELTGVMRSAGLSGVRVVPLRRLNGLIVFGNTDRALDLISQWVTRLDAPTRESANSLWVYHPKNTSAEALSRTLNSIAGGQGGGAIAPVSGETPSQGPPEDGAVAATLGGAGDADLRAAVDKETNTLLVSAPAWRWVQLQKILAEVDRPQAQVAIEATVLEVTLRDEFRLGVDWSFLMSSDRLGVSLVGNETGKILPVYPGFSVTFLDGDVQAAVNALGSRTRVEVISAPKIVTLDNRPARLQVGDQVPVLTQTARSTSAEDAPLVSNVDYRNSGVILNVTPRISGEDRVTIEVAQEVSTVVQTRSSTIDSPTIQQRKLESTLVLTSGSMVALGGLISRAQNVGDSGVPWLKDIPGVGALFRSSSNNEDRTELIVLLRARIIHDAASAEANAATMIQAAPAIRERGLLDEP